MTDPRQAKTLGEACANGDGTFNGFKLLSWLTETVAPGKGVPEEEVKRTYDALQARKKASEQRS